MFDMLEAFEYLEDMDATNTTDLAIIADIRETTVATSTVSLGLVTLALTSRHWCRHTARKEMRCDGTFALDLTIGDATLKTFTWDSSPDDWDSPETHMESVLAIDIGALLGIADVTLCDVLRNHVLAHFDATCQREVACEDASLPECENAKSAAKRQLIADAKAAGYTADHSADATRLKRGSVSVTVWGRGLTTDNRVRLDIARGMSLAETRAHLGL